MKTHLLFSLIALCATVFLSGCDDGPGHHEYPGLQDLEVLAVADLRTTAPVPGRYNVSGTVVEVTTCYCPPDAMCGPCAFPNGIIISETGEPLPAAGYSSKDLTYLLVEAENPEQFREGQRYVLSVEVAEGYAQRPVYVAGLLGYKRAE